MNTLARIALVTLVLGLAACHGEPDQPSVPPLAASDQVEAGHYLAQIGDCAACHTVPGGTQYAGGRPIVTPYGSIYSTNLTPDAETGLGNWSADDFWQALHHGRSKTLGPLYPAFPFTDFTKLSRADADALFAYFKSLPATHSATPAAQMRFPYNIRPLMWVWRTLYFSPGSYQADAAKPASWNRGAYLVQGLGHCESCHSDYNLLGAVKSASALHGGFMPGAGWYAPPIAGPFAGGGPQAADALAHLLRGGVSGHDAVVGPMASVVYYSLQHLKPEDAQAIAEYLGSLPAPPPARSDSGMLLSAADATALRERGRNIYQKQCQDCHAEDGSGRPPAYPALAGNPAVLQSVVNPVRVIANGGFPPSTADNPRPYGMPAYIGDLGDEDIAAVLSYVRASWGNDAPAVAPVEVGRDKVLPSW